MVFEMFSVTGHARACVLVEMFSLAWRAFVCTKVRFSACFTNMRGEVLFCAGGALMVIEVFGPTGLAFMVTQMFEVAWLTLVFIEMCLFTEGWRVIPWTGFTGVGR